MMQNCQTRQRLGPEDALGWFPSVDSSMVTDVCVCALEDSAQFVIISICLRADEDQNMSGSS